ncbi:MAG: DNA topoisomerase IB, partial [Cyclobacteriaceae bacterium]
MKPDEFLYVDSKTKGYSRRRGAKGFLYLDHKGESITDKKKIKKVDKLVIPPNWRKVWIAPKKKMHIQAYGYDESGRKQYIYHPEWTKINDTKKFDKLLGFGVNLPRLRRYASKHLKKKRWGKKKAAALAVMLLDRHYLRVGNKKYALQNDTFGISTLKVKHIEKGEQGFSISYKAKGNKKRKIRVGNKKLQKLLLDISEIPGNHIFQYYGRDNQTYTMSSGRINQYIRQYSG